MVPFKWKLHFSDAECYGNILIILRFYIYIYIFDVSIKNSQMKIKLIEIRFTQYFCLHLFSVMFNLENFGNM